MAKGKRTGTTTIGLPITLKREDQALLKKLDRLKIKRGLRSRTDLLRTLILEEWRRQYPNTKGGAK
jgi:metal-responsive CopG/Arc/MetJ family transcriptional regulator